MRARRGVGEVGGRSPPGWVGCRDCRRWRRVGARGGRWVRCRAGCCAGVTRRHGSARIPNPHVPVFPRATGRLVRLLRIPLENGAPRALPRVALRRCRRRRRPVRRIPRCPPGAREPSAGRVRPLSRHRFVRRERSWMLRGLHVRTGCGGRRVFFFCPTPSAGPAAARLVLSPPGPASLLSKPNALSPLALHLRAPRCSCGALRVVNSRDDLGVTGCCVAEGGACTYTLPPGIPNTDFCSDCCFGMYCGVGDVCIIRD